MEETRARPLLAWLLGRQSTAPRLSEKDALVLDILSDSRQRYGLELVRESGGALKPGTVYVVLSRLEEKGFVLSELASEEPWAGGPRRRLYAITDDGRQILRRYEAFAVEVASLALSGVEP